jgi:hypothetical protein
MDGASVEQGKDLTPRVIDFLADAQCALGVVEGFFIALKEKVGSAESEKGDGFTPWVINFLANRQGMPKMDECFFGLMKIKVGIAEASPGPCFSLPVVEVLSGSEADAVSADQVGPVLAQVEEIPQGKRKLASNEVLAGLGGLMGSRHEIARSTSHQSRAWP